MSRYLLPAATIVISTIVEFPLVRCQFTTLKSRFAKGIEEISIPTSGGMQKMICLALRKLNGWLNTISPNKVRPEIRDRVIQYQEY